MADEPLSINSAAILDAMIPSVKMVVTPHIIIIPSGTTYTRLNYPRPVLLEPLDPATAGVIYTYPNTNPSADAVARQTQGGAFLYAKGDWFVRHSAATAQSFRVDDSGGSGATTQLAPTPTPAAAAVPNRSTFYTAQRNVTTAGTPVQCVAQAIPDGFALAIKANPNNTGNVGIGNSSANANLSTGAPMILAPGEPARLFVTNANLVWVDSEVNGEGICLASET